LKKIAIVLSLALLTLPAFAQSPSPTQIEGFRKAVTSAGNLAGFILACGETNVFDRKLTPEKITEQRAQLSQSAAKYGMSSTESNRLYDTGLNETKSQMAAMSHEQLEQTCKQFAAQFEAPKK
jgi:hypothetical protein